MTENYAKLTLFAGRAAIATAVSLILLKLMAVMMTGSASILASLTDSMLDLAASVANLFALKLAVQPADEDHRFGHGKAEGLAGLAQSAFISGSCVLLLIHATDRIIHPQPIAELTVGLAVMIASIVLTLVLVIFQHYVANKTGSLAIKADSLHYRGDLLMNFAIVLALVLSWYGFEEVDGYFALAIALYILYSAFSIATQAVDALMDKALDEDVHQEIIDIVSGHPEVHGLHELRTRQSGPTVFIQFHLELDDQLTLYRAHQISDDVEAKLRARFKQADILIHQDPQSLIQLKNDTLA